MSQDNLATRYRPQTFATVAGQDAVKSILSRAASTRRVAPAYLFSGTRGVGKTTMARVFAKALNCQRGPAAEPCNECPLCRQITLGAAVDVVEIDGASNTGVDNVRRLKEDVGYAPLEGRYKVIIIDEAHMLSKAAFNALLKTLEEPPKHVTFILATTEPEKFPATIVSRCQHFVFKRLTQPELVAHLRCILEREQVEAEDAAVNLVARRGAGSVRDSMSLLGQVLALGSGVLQIKDVREVLGLAGQEVFVRLAQCVLERDLPGLNALLVEILDQGVDLGFFLRELGACWRNLFLLIQLGEGARSIIDLPVAEIELWSGLAPKFALTHVHAAWQMTMDSQRKILTSTEPALALELLLVNLAFLPDLLEAGRGTEQGPTQPPLSARPAPLGQVTRSRPDTGTARPAPQAGSGPAPQVPAPAASGSAPRTWEGFVQYCALARPKPVTCLKGAQGELQGTELVVRSSQPFLCDRLLSSKPLLTSLTRTYFGPEVNLRIETLPSIPRKTGAELRQMADTDAVVAEARNKFQARIMDVRPVPENSKENTI